MSETNASIKYRPRNGPRGAYALRNRFYLDIGLNSRANFSSLDQKMTSSSEEKKGVSRRASGLFRPVSDRCIYSASQETEHA